MGATDLFAWPTPDPSDPVFEGAAAIHNLGQAVEDELLKWWVRKPADESVVSSTLFQQDDHFAFAVDAGAVYYVEAMIFYDGHISGDFKCEFAVPGGGASFRAACTYEITTVDTTVGGAATLVAVLKDGSTNTIVQMGTLGVNVRTAFTLLGNLQTLTSSGTFALRWAQNTSNATATRILAGSQMRLRRMS
jgi:hypothetical protein